MRATWSAEECARLAEELELDPRDPRAGTLYAARCIGSDESLVLHGGGNVSCKGEAKLPGGRRVAVVFVKASGRDLAQLGPADLPALELAPLKDLARLDDLPPGELGKVLMRSRLDPEGPAPSVEALMHAFLPDAVVLHCHADAILAFGNRPEGPAELGELLSPSFGLLPWRRPGFALAKELARLRAAEPALEGAVLLGHGLVTWGADAEEAFARLAGAVARVEREIERRLAGRPLFEAVAPPGRAELERRAADFLPHLRGRLARAPGGRPMLLAWRPEAEALAAAEDPRAPELFGAPPLTPDHLIRIKGPWLVCGLDEAGLERVLAAYIEDQRAYQAALPGGPPPGADLLPRVVLARGLGLVGLGRDAREARVAADLALCNLRGKGRAAALSRYEGLPWDECRALEYWELERAKLGAEGGALRGRVALVTGAAGAIGRAVCRALAARGAFVVLTDLEGDPLGGAAAHLEELGFGERIRALPMDVTDEASVTAAFAETVRATGGLDIVVANAGIAHVAPIAELDLADWRRVVAVNQTGTLLTFKAAAKILKAQAAGGALVLVATKNVPMPGADFVAYSASKAAAVQIARVAALELAPLGVTVNLVHPDAVFADERSGRSSGLWDAVGPARMRARGLDPAKLRDYYRGRNLLGVPVTADQVAEAVAFFAEGRTPTTGAALTVDGGHLGTFYR